MLQKGRITSSTSPAPVAKIEDLVNYGAVIVGTGTRLGRMASQVENVLDKASGLWMKGALQGRGGYLHLDGDPAWRPRNHAIFDDHQPVGSLSKQGVMVASFLALLGIAMTIYLTLFLTEPLHALHATFAGVAPGK
jgi:hypothetical protein